MKKPLQRLAGQVSAEDQLAGDPQDPAYFSTLFQAHEDDGLVVADWAMRSAQVHAQALDPEQGAAIFTKLWAGDRHLATLGAAELARMATYLEFVKVPAQQQVIGQNEQGDYLIIVLEGAISVDRVQPWGRARLAEAHAGDMLGEMSLLDAGARFSACTTITPSLLAVLDAKRLDDLIAREPRLALALLASLSRRLSLRLRQVSARLSALLSRA